MGVILWKKLPASMADDHEAPYFYALGRFENEHSNDTTARVALSEQRTNAAITTIKHALRSRPEQDRQELEQLFDHFNTITNFRNKCVHRAADLTPQGTYLSSNEVTAKSDGDLEYVEFRVDDVWHATCDLNLICARLTALSMPGADFDAPSSWRFVAPPVRRGPLR
jgi:hypothetical protein